MQENAVFTLIRTICKTQFVQLYLLNTIVQYAYYKRF